MPSASDPLAPLAEPSAWAAQLGNRLLHLRASLAGEEGVNRQDRLEEEMRRELQAVPAEKRASYLSALAERFPSWQLATSSLYASAPAASATQTPEEITNAFLEAVPRLSAEQREKLKLRLVTLGLVATNTKPLEGEALTEVQTKLKLAPNEAIDPQRLGKLFATFAEVMLTLDQLVWNVWRGVAPSSAIRRDPAQGDFRQLVRRSLAGDAEASAAQVQQQLESTRQLIAGLLAGLGPAAQGFAKRYQERYSPEAVLTSVTAEGSGGIFRNVEAKCWKKYMELSTELTEEAIEGEVREAVVKYAEDLIRGRRR